MFSHALLELSFKVKIKEKKSCDEVSVVWRLIGDWSIVGRVGSNDSIRVHHVLTGQVGLAHFSQAEWREGELGHHRTVLM